MWTGEEIIYFEKYAALAKAVIVPKQREILKFDSID